MSPAESRTRADRAIAALRDLVLAGALAPGERLFEVALAGRLAISRTPVREALAALEAEGLLDRMPAGGYAVRAFTLADVADAIELRGVLEGTAARLAAERGVAPARLAPFAAVVAELDAVLGTDPEAMDFDGYVALNRRFHALLAGLSGSALIAAEVARAARLPFASASAFLEGQREVPAFRRSLITAQAQHRAILQAIDRREGARAEALAREHARLALSNLDYVMHRDRSLIGRVPGLALVANHTGQGKEAHG